MENENGGDKKDTGKTGGIMEQRRATGQSLRSLCGGCHYIKQHVLYTKDTILFLDKQNFTQPIHQSYLPIMVECCWTAASSSLSKMVHSPMVMERWQKWGLGSDPFFPQPTPSSASQDQPVLACTSRGYTEPLYLISSPPWPLHVDLAGSVPRERDCLLLGPSCCAPPPTWCWGGGKLNASPLLFLPRSIPPPQRSDACPPPAAPLCSALQHML